MFILKKDFNGNGIEIKKGEYTKEQLIKMYGSEESFNFCLTCTSLKDFLEKKVESKPKFLDKVLDIVTKGKNSTEEEVTEEEVTEEEVTEEEVTEEEVTEEEVTEEATEEEVTNFNIVFVAQENIKKGRKNAVLKDQKLTLEELSEIFGDKTEEIINSDKIIETKIVKKDV